MEIKVVENENEVYIKDKLLGEGAFGKAYLVKHKQTNELLVIKEMSIQHMSSKEKEETVKEAQILKNLNHPNIVNFREVYMTKNSKLKIVMEYAQCGDLAKAITQRKAQKKFFEEAHILDWFTQICLAIKHVHDRKILHRDIKGQNIFIAKNNSLKLGDFGIARVLNKTHDKARTVVGTPYYLSPEIIENKPYSFKSDIWSIGAVLYEMCALSPPFTAASLQMLALKIVKGSYPPLQGSYSMELKSLIAQMLSLDPNRRPGVNEILQKPVIKERIRKFLSETKRIAEFSHTILHNQRVEILANKLVQIQKEKQSPSRALQAPQSKERLSSANNRSKQKDLEQERIKLKEDQARMEAVLQKKREDERRKDEKRKQDEIRRGQQQKRRRDEQKRKWIRIEQEKKQQMQREYEQNFRKGEAAKARRIEEYNKQMEIENLKQQRYEIEERKWKEAGDQKKKAKLAEEERKKQELNDFARKQYFQNLEIRKRAQERAKREQDGYYSQPQQAPQQQELEPQNFHYQNRPSSNQENRPSSKEQRRNQSDCYGSPADQQIENAYENPHFNKKRTSEKKVSVDRKPIAQRQPSTKGSQPTIAKQDSKKKIEEERQKMRRDRQNFIKNRNKGPDEEPDLKEEGVGKWGKRRSASREKHEESPRFGDGRAEMEQQEEEKGFNTLIEDSENLFLEVKSPMEFENYVDELEGILNDVHERIQMLPEIPASEEIVFREDDELEFSLTAENLVVKKELEIDSEQVDLDYFSNYSKLETLRMQLEEAFGLENFIRLYRYIEKQVMEKGLDGFDIIEAMKEVGTDIDRKVLTKNVTLLLTLVSLEDRMSFT